jgi:hypothetical protein
VEHYGGQRWREIRVGALAHGGLVDVVAISRNDVWVSGMTDASTFEGSVVLHWNGHGWNRVPLPKIEAWASPR